jgi:hypothetical protein
MTAAAAATRAAPSAIKVICQPGMPPVVITRVMVFGLPAADLYCPPVAVPVSTQTPRERRTVGRR